jgi:hypothetical protein
MGIAEAGLVEHDRSAPGAKREDDRLGSEIDGAHGRED